MMKQLKSLLIAAILFVGIQTATAQAKIAHINLQELITSMPDMKAANAQLEKLTQSYDTEYNKLVQEFRAKIDQYDKESATVTAAINDTRTKEVQDMQRRIQEYQQSAAKELEEKQQALYKPIMEKSKAAINKVAKAKGYQYVLDATVGAGVIMADGPDLLADVKKELGF